MISAELPRKTPESLTTENTELHREMPHRNGRHIWHVKGISISSFAVPLAERQLITRVRHLVERSGTRAQKSADHLIAGIGDDCAVLRIPAGHETLVTTDFSLEGVHFRREWDSAQNIGHRCLARGLSDIAAMGGEPVAVFLSLALPANIPQRWADGFLKGLLKVANEFGVPLASGDIAQSTDGIPVVIVELGSVPTGKAVLR